MVTRNRKINRARDRQRKIGIHWTRPDFEYWWRHMIDIVVKESRARENQQ